jgi:GxxExxY protein
MEDSEKSLPSPGHGSGRHNVSAKGYDFGTLTGRIIATAIEAHRELGPGFQEVVYQRALAIELDASGVEFTREQNISLYYKGAKLDVRRVDFIVEDCIVEIKARKELQPEDYMQTLSYLKASRYQVALLLNFGAQKVEVKRFVNDKGRHAHTAD